MSNGGTAAWIDVVDPGADEVRRRSPVELSDRVVERLTAPHAEGIRPLLESHGDYVFGVLLVPLAVPEEDLVLYQEVDVVLAPDAVLTVRKSVPGRGPVDLTAVVESSPKEAPAGRVAYHLADLVAERFLDLIDALGDEIDELEDHIETWPAARIRGRLSELRHDVLTIRRTVAPTRDAARRVVDGRLSLESGPLFDSETQLAFADAYDKLLRATEGLEYARDLIASARDYHQSQIATEQNEVLKRLAVIASVLLLPTFIVGVYGQNFEHMPELTWRLGYLWSWFTIVVSTVAQLVFFRRRGWI
jgi:magnesium transporter